MNRTIQTIVAVVAAVLIAGVSFYAGTLYAAQGQTAARTGQNAGGPPGQGGFTGQGRGQGGQGGAFGGGVFGQVGDVSGGTFTVTDANGKKTTVTVTDTTLIEKNASIKVTDLQDGENVIVSGTLNADGTFTARSVQVAPAGRVGAGVGNPGAGGQGGGRQGTPTPAAGGNR